MSNKNIESVLLEQRSFPPTKAFTARARLKPEDLEALHRRAAPSPQKGDTEAEGPVPADKTQAALLQTHV